MCNVPQWGLARKNAGVWGSHSRYLHLDAAAALMKASVGGHSYFRLAISSRTLDVQQARFDNVEQTNILLQN